jgi:hypothetical protein
VFACQPIPLATIEAPPAATPSADAPRGDEGKRAALLQARASFETFIERADGNPEYAKAVESAKLHIEEIDYTLTLFMGDGG